MNEELHQILLSCGYTFQPPKACKSEHDERSVTSGEGLYVKEYLVNGESFHVALIFNGDPHLQLPLAVLQRYPERLKGILIPHINYGFFICYVTEKEADWDSNDLNSTYRSVDAQIHNTLTCAADNQNTERGLQELEGELAAYWAPIPKLIVYLLSNPEQSPDLYCLRTKAYQTPRYQHASDDRPVEWLALRNEEQLEIDKWLESRDLELVDHSKIATAHVQVNLSRLAGIDWPPKNLRAVFDWLKANDQSAFVATVNHFVENPTKRHLLLLDAQRQGTVGVYVEISLKATGIDTYAAGKSTARKSLRRIKHNQVAARLSSRGSVKVFSRVSVVEAHRNTLLMRNRRKPETGNLSRMRIALIGCGTIGGYVADLLMRSGAGCGKKPFQLYDGDSFGPQNFGRHSLTSADIGMNKAQALAGRVASATHLLTKIEGIPNDFCVEIKELQRYDIIIDATGRPPISKRLAKLARSVDKSSRPTLIHGFNDGNGRASKVIIDDGRSCYGCVISDPAFYKNRVDLRFRKINMEQEKHLDCGSTYTPYDAAVSVVTAGLIQEAALETLEPEKGWTYKEHLFTNERSRKPRILSSNPQCPICNG